MAVTKYLYTRGKLKASINARIHGKIGMITNPNTLIDDVVNEVSGLYLRTAKRKRHCSRTERIQREKRNRGPFLSSRW